MSAGSLIGKWGEDRAVRYLKKRGYRIMCRNYRRRNGEVDVVARDGACWVFVEVKTRSSLSYGTPAEAVTSKKILAMQRTALAYLQKAGEADAPMRFDVIEVFRADGKWKITHIPSAF